MFQLWCSLFTAHKVLRPLSRSAPPALVRLAASYPLYPCGETTLKPPLQSTQNPSMHACMHRGSNHSHWPCRGRVTASEGQSAYFHLGLDGHGKSAGPNPIPISRYYMLFCELQIVMESMLPHHSDQHRQRWARSCNLEGVHSVP